ncbi:IS4 family transposase [Candidatus Tisiphia endosymbiont of Nedyus quadrimaculatus]|uniref:IS4 family transposase n=1 Tax=Candidatus Tisiphia endosymbiont of Nedyus quadrimaculatus TaxID=3139332 RepID=UPI00345EA8B7
MSSVGLGEGSNKLFFESEFESLVLKDQRLKSRALKIFTALMAKFTSCIKNLFDNPQDQRQAYDFFVNNKVNNDHLIEPHFRQTTDRINNNNDNLLLVIQDSTYLNFTKHKAKIDIGRIGKNSNTEQYGIIQHSSLCTTLNNEPLGLIDLQFYDNEDFINKASRDKRCAEDKKTNYWVKANKNLRDRVKDTSRKLVRVSDRESDFFDYIHDLVNHDELFVIRAFHNRYTGEKASRREAKIIELIDKEKIEVQSKFEIYGPETRSLEEVLLNIKKLEKVSIPVLEKMLNKENYHAIKLNVVKCYDNDRCWILLTNLPVDNIEKLGTVINCYRMRWHIEDYHKILKTGVQIEKVYLHSSSEAIKNLLTMIAICACRLYWIIFMGRNDDNNRASKCFREHEWQAIYMYHKLEIPKIEPSIKEVVLLIARLSGYKHTKHSAPPSILLVNE